MVSTLGNPAGVPYGNWSIGLSEPWTRIFTRILGGEHNDMTTPVAVPAVNLAEGLEPRPAKAAYQHPPPTPPPKAIPGAQDLLSQIQAENVRLRAELDRQRVSNGVGSSSSVVLQGGTHASLENVNVTPSKARAPVFPYAPAPQQPQRPPPTPSPQQPQQHSQQQAQQQP